MIKAPFKRSYRADADGWVAGQRVAAGDIVQLTPAQAKYEPVTAEPIDPPKQAPARRRSSEEGSV